jgi:hypothetical protein
MVILNDDNLTIWTDKKGNIAQPIALHIEAEPRRRKQQLFWKWGA